MIENLETLNKRLIDQYGKYLDGQANWRIIFSDDEIEKRWVNHSKDGFELLTPIVEERPKYRQWVNPACYVLERLLEIPDFMQTDLVVNKSYEPVWTFRDKNNNPLIPQWGACKLIIDTVLENSSKKMGRKYKDPLEDLNDPKIEFEVRRARLEKIEEELFGNETPVGDALSTKTGIVVP